MLKNYKNKAPELGAGCFVAENAALIGAVTLGDDSSVWYGAVLRADSEPITVGRRSNIQDNVTIHNNTGHPVCIGDDVSVGHNAVVHGATLEDGCLIGMGAVVLDEAVIGEGSIVGAGAVVTKGMKVPANSLVMGIPARVIRTVPEGANLANAEEYVRRKTEYLEENQ